MALTIYGSPRSRTMRVLWAASELGLDYTHVPLAWDDPALKGAEYLAINPAGVVPAIVDDGFALSESLAIILYLAKKYAAAPFYPTTLEGEAQVWRWSLWAQGQLEPWVQQDVRLDALRKASIETAKPEIARALSLIAASLSYRPWLLGDEFTVADLNVAAVLSPSRASRLDLEPYVQVQDWLARCYARPAAMAVRRKFAA